MALVLNLAAVPMKLVAMPVLAGLAAGTYSGAITVTSAGAANSPTVIPVTLNLTAAPSPTLGSVAPINGSQGQTINVTLTGTNFVNGATVNVSGTGVNVGTVTANSATSLTATLTIASNATLGPRNISVTTPNGTSAPSEQRFAFKGLGHLRHGTAVDTVKFLHQTPGVAMVGGKPYIASLAARGVIGSDGVFVPLPAKPLAMTGTPDGSAAFVGYAGGLLRTGPSGTTSRAVAGCRYRKTSASGKECCGPSDRRSASSVAAA